MQLQCVCDSIGGGNAVLTPVASLSQDAQDVGGQVTTVTVAAAAFPAVAWTVGARYLVTLEKTT